MKDPEVPVWPWGYISGMGCAFALAALTYWMGRVDGERNTCSADSFQSGAMGKVIADCVTKGGRPNINYRDRFECTKTVEVKP